MRGFVCMEVEPAPDGRPRWAASPFEAETRDALIALKFHRELWRAPGLGRALADTLLPVLPAVDLVVPVPLSNARLRGRGFNQSVLLARPLARALGVPLRLSVLRRTRHDPPQALRGADERAEIAGAYAASRGRRTRAGLMGRNVLLVDDVTTTGHTAAACASALDAAGAAWIGLASVAHALPPAQGAAP